jgi:hypothetical protein
MRGNIIIVLVDPTVIIMINISVISFTCNHFETHFVCFKREYSYPIHISKKKQLLESILVLKTHSVAVGKRIAVSFEFVDRLLSQESTVHKKPTSIIAYV